ncbi:3-hydroxyanthranilic acid dioxygenase [Dispira simplex]|nr:3-hydroxyanthranilic acid dioxygenase [Dispira simplex]
MGFLAQPINFPHWLETHRHVLAPPVGNAVLQQGDFLIMVVGGPNQRTDYHVNETEEWFYQYKGDMILKVVDESKPAKDPDRFIDVNIRQGDMFLLPAGVPHSPVRFAETVGLVVERKRKPDEVDRLRWYCEGCLEVVHEEGFYCQDLGKDLKPIIQKYAQQEALRTCRHCGYVNVAK